MPFPNSNNLPDHRWGGPSITSFNVGDREFAIYVTGTNRYGVVEMTVDASSGELVNGPIIQTFSGGQTYNGVTLENGAMGFNTGAKNEMLTHTTSSGDQFIIGGKEGQVVFKATGNPGSPLDPAAPLN